MLPTLKHADNPGQKKHPYIFLKECTYCTYSVHHTKACDVRYRYAPPIANGCPHRAAGEYIILYIGKELIINHLGQSGGVGGGGLNGFYIEPFFYCSHLLRKHIDLCAFYNSNNIRMYSDPPTVQFKHRGQINVHTLKDTFMFKILVRVS